MNLFISSTPFLSATQTHKEMLSTACLHGEGLLGGTPRRGEVVNSVRWARTGRWSWSRGPGLGRKVDGEKRQSCDLLPKPEWREREKENPSSPYCHYVRAFRPEKIENPGKILLANAETFLCRGMLVLAGASWDVVFVVLKPWEERKSLSYLLLQPPKRVWTCRDFPVIAWVSAGREHLPPSSLPIPSPPPSLLL